MAATAEPSTPDVIIGDRERSFLRAWFQWNLGDDTWLDTMLEDLDNIDSVEDDLRAEGILD